MYKFFEGIEEHIFFLPIEIETEESEENDRAVCADGYKQVCPGFNRPEIGESKSNAREEYGG